MVAQVIRRKVASRNYSTYSTRKEFVSSESSPPRYDPGCWWALINQTILTVPLDTQVTARWPPGDLQGTVPCCREKTITVVGQKQSESDQMSVYFYKVDRRFHESFHVGLLESKLAMDYQEFL